MFAYILFFPIACVGLGVFTIVKSILSLKKGGSGIKIFFSALTFLCIIFAILSWFLNFGWYRFFLTILPMPFVYSAFFVNQGVLLVAIACIREISGFAIPILAASFLISGLIAGFIVSKNFKSVMAYFLKGAAAMLPAVIMIAIASSVKLVMDESGIIDTVMYLVLNLLIGKSKFITILLIYALILFLQLFIGSASAKIFLVMPIVLPITNTLGISPSLVILTYCMADGFTDVILPTNPVLLIGLSMANVSYFKWLKWTWKLQLLLFVISILVLLFGVFIGY